MTYKTFVKWWSLRLNTHIVFATKPDIFAVFYAGTTNAVSCRKNYCEMGLLRGKRFIAFPSVKNVIKTRSFGGVDCPPVFFIV